MFGSLFAERQVNSQEILDNINNVMVLESKFKDKYPDAGKAFPTYDTTPPTDARRMRPVVNTTAFV